MTRKKLEVVVSNDAPRRYCATPAEIFQRTGPGRRCKICGGVGCPNQDKRTAEHQPPPTRMAQGRQCEAHTADRSRCEKSAAGCFMFGASEWFLCADHNARWEAKRGEVR